MVPKTPHSLTPVVRALEIFHSNTRLMLGAILPALLIGTSGCERQPVADTKPVQTPSAATVSALEPGAAFYIYPDSKTSANPRVPCIPTVAAEGGGKRMDVEALFRYALAPFVEFPKGGILTARILDNSRRESKDILSLLGGSASLVLRVGPASEGRIPTLVLVKEGTVVSSIALKKPLPKAWTTIQIQWDERAATLTVADEDAVTLPLPSALAPKSITLQTAMVNDLKIVGDGQLSLNWQNGYAATVEPRPSSTDVVSRVFGFDAYAVGQDKTKRDFPMLQVLNGSTEAREVTYSMDLRGEVTALAKQWSQKISVPARSGVMVPLQFPVPLLSDVYHLDVRSISPDYTTKRHFLFVENRNESSGPEKFGLHDSDRHTFGFWPDALPIGICHLYSRWGYTHGPAWTKDPGITEETPPDEWNWDPRIDQAIRQGLSPYVSISSQPFYSWMREREYEPAKMDQRDWATLGGFPKLSAYRKFVKALAEKYKGQVHRYEVENEPNAYLGGMPPKDYVEIAKVVSEEIHSVDPTAQVFGISGTGAIEPWIKAVFEVGGAAAMDGVSIHTYVTPGMPEAAGLPEKLKAIQAQIASAGKAMPLLNSETGTYVALREDVEHPIPHERLKELIKQGVGSLSLAEGWPSYAVDEWSGSTSIVRNAVFNFLAGAEGFIFFGWNDKWPNSDWWTAKSGQACFALISASKDGERTPSLQTLAISVLTAQLKGAKQQAGKAIDEGGILGGSFPKVDGGEVTVLWSPQGKRSAIIDSGKSPLEVVTLFGQHQRIPVSSAGGKNLVRLDVGPEPVYLHTKTPGLRLLPSPVISVSQDGSSGFQFTLVNKYPEAWAGGIDFSNAQGWAVTPASQPFSLDPGKRVKIQAACTIPMGVKRGAYSVDASLKLPDGTPFGFPIPINVRPTFVVPKAPAEFAWTNPSAWNDMRSSLKLDQADQVTIGRAPLLASLQEEQYWKGPNELSGEAMLAANDTDLYVYVEVRDANQREPVNWPGVLGSSVEVFLDLRATDAGLGSATYGPGVHQIVLKAPTVGTPELWEPTDKLGKLVNVTVAGSRLGAEKYWIALRIPRAANGISQSDPLGFDIGINGPPAKGAGRKTQIMLFGTVSNASNASAFGSATIKK